MNQLNLRKSDSYDKEPLRIIHIEELYNFFIRNKVPIFVTTLISVFIASCIPIKTKWQGMRTMQFENDRSYTYVSGVSSQYFIYDVKNPYENVLTANNLLKDDSFLLRIYNLNTNKEIAEENNNKILSFKEWKQNFNISYVRNDRLINIKYKCINKNNCTFVLDQIFENYKDIHEKKQRTLLDIASKRYEKLIDIYKSKNKKSLTRLLKFNDSNGRENKGLDALYLKIINELGVKDTKVLEINIEDSSDKREYNFLDFTTLLREATLNSSILNRAFYEKELINLEKENAKVPWFRKSDIFIKEVKIPTRFSLLSFSILLGFIFGTIYTIIYDIKEGFLQSKREIEENYDYPLISELKFRNNQVDQNSIRLLKRFHLDKIDKKIIFITTGKEELNIFNRFEEELRQILPDKDFEIIYDPLKLSDKKNNFILIHINKSKRKELNKLIQELKMIKVNINGIIIISSNN